MQLTEQQRAAIRHPIRWLFNPEPEQPGEVPRRELTFYSLGLMGQCELNNMAGNNWFFHFCTNVLMIDPELVGRMTGAVTVFDAANDPVAGALIDIHRFKDGRKLLPWIKLTAPFIAISAFLLFVNWNLPSVGLKVFYCVAVYVIWDILYSFQDAAIWGMTAAISPHASQRARASQWAEIGVMIGGTLPGLLLPMLSGNGAFGLNQQQVYLIFATVLCLGGGFQSMFTLRTTERVREQPEEDKKASIWRNIGVLRHNYILWLFLICEILRSCAPYVDEVYLFQQMTYKWGSATIAAPVVVTVLAFFNGLPGAGAKFFATKLANRLGGMKRVLVISSITGIVMRVFEYFIGVKTLPALVLVYILEAVYDLPNGIYGIAMRTLISDSVEYVEWKTGQRTEGITMSVRNLMSKASGALKRYMQGRCLSFLQFSGENVKAGIPQNAHFLKWIWPMYRLGPVLGLALGLIPLLLLKYPESLKRQVETEMAERRRGSEQLETSKF